MSEKTALITAYNKKQVTDLAVGLHEHGYEIVSLGGTAAAIENAGIPVTNTEAFLGGIGMRIVPYLPSRPQREVVAAHLSLSLSLPKTALQTLAWPAIDLAYINLMPSEQQVGSGESYHGVKNDKGGANMIQAAIEGGRAVLYAPNQIDDLLAGLNNNEQPDADPESRRMFGEAAICYLQDYYRKTGEMVADTSHAAATGSHVY